MFANVELNHRIVIAELLHAVMRDTGYAPRTVYRILSSLGQGKDIQRKAHGPNSDRKHTKFFFFSA